MSFVTASPYCLLLEILEEQSIWDADRLSVGLGFFIALIVGGLIALGCAKLCIKDIVKYKTQDLESGYMKSHGYANHQKEKLLQTSSKKKRSKSSKKKRAVSSKKKSGEATVLINPIILEAANSGSSSTGEANTIANGEEDEGPNTRGLSEALVLNTGAEMEAEIGSQDMEAINNLEKDLREENLNTMMAVLRTLLNQQLAKGKLTPEQYQGILTQYQDNIGNAVRTNQAEQTEEEEELKKKIKNKDELERELEKLHPKYIQRLSSEVQNEKEKFRRGLLNESKLTEQEVDALMGQLAENMALLENKLGMERLRQAANLEQRLARRRELAEHFTSEKTNSEEDASFEVEAKDAVLTKLVDDGEMSERQKQELLNQFKEDQRRIEMKNREEQERQQAILAERLKRHRAKELQKLEEAHEKQRDNFLQSTEQAQDPKAIVEGYHKLLQNHRQQREDLTDELDQEEAKEFLNLQKTAERNRGEQGEEMQRNFEDGIREKSQISDRELQRIMSMNDQLKAEHARQQEEQRRRTKARLDEKRQLREQKQEEDNRIALAEQKALKEQQETTMEKVLKSQVDLDNDAKQKILKEHEQNMGAINNQLEMSKLRQKKAMELKLQSRKAKVAELKQKAEEAKQEKAGMKEKEREKLQQQLQKQIEAEEQKLEEEKSQALSDLRDRLAAETNDALMEQERQLGYLISRLQVGKARRQAILQRQDKTIKELEEQLAGKVIAESRDDDRGESNEMVDALINQHQSEVSQLEDRMQEAKSRQDQLLQEKIQAKRLKKERKVENQIEEEAQEEWNEQRQRGAGIASNILGNTMLERRHRMAMDQLEHEMSLEMQKQREDLNRELEMELQQALEENKKSFLAQLAAISNVSKEEMIDLVDNAVIDAGGTAGEAKRLGKEMKAELTRAHSSLSAYREKARRNYERYDNKRYDRDYNYDGNRYESKRYHRENDEDDYDYGQLRSVPHRPGSGYYR